MITFSDLGTQPEIATALAHAGIETPFPIQELAIPIALGGADLIAQARTGTGKTLAFGVPLLQRLTLPYNPDAPGLPQALVITPTRELALQVSGDLAQAGAKQAVRILTVYGGVGYEPQLSGIERGVDVVVGTPGRLLDLVDSVTLTLSYVKTLVLDEADRMLDLGFLPDVERLIAATHEQRQTMLFSATLPSEVVRLARWHMRHPVNIRAEGAEDSQLVPTTAQFVYRTHDLDKAELLARILQAEGRSRAIVFCSTKRAVDRVWSDLADRGFNAGTIHGDLGQDQREKTLRRFREGTVEVLVATDVAARGLDIDGVSHVINHTCPEDEFAYLHRIGRTARAGATGVAITFVDWADLTRWKVISTALELPVDDPPETYSTSPHLYTDLAIPADATGRVAASRAPTRYQPRPTARGGRPDRSDRLEQSERSRQPTGSTVDEQRGQRSRQRRRRRLRGGIPVEVGSLDLPDGTPSGKTMTSAPLVQTAPDASEVVTNQPQVASQPPGRSGRSRRRRRRIRGSQRGQSGQE